MSSKPLEAARTESAPSARTGLELVLGQLEQHGLASSRIQLLDLRSSRHLGDSGESSTLRISIGALFRDADELAAARSYEQFLEGVRGLEQTVDVTPASTRRASDGHGIWMRELVVTLQLPAEPLGPSARDFDYALRATAIDRVGPIYIRVETEESTPLGESRGPTRRIRPEETPQASGTEPGFELATICDLLRELEREPAGARVLDVHIARVSPARVDPPSPDLFSFELTVSP